MKIIARLVYTQVYLFQTGVKIMTYTKIPSFTRIFQIMNMAIFDSTIMLSNTAQEIDLMANGSTTVMVSP